MVVYQKQDCRDEEEDVQHYDPCSLERCKAEPCPDPPFVRLLCALGVGAWPTDGGGVGVRSAKPWDVGGAAGGEDGFVVVAAVDGEGEGAGGACEVVCEAAVQARGIAVVIAGGHCCG